MAAELVSNVFVESEGLGQVYEAGTKATAELRKLIPNPAAWSDEEDGDAAPRSASADHHRASRLK